MLCINIDPLLSRTHFYYSDKGFVHRLFRAYFQPPVLQVYMIIIIFSKIVMNILRVNMVKSSVIVFYSRDL